MSPEIKKIQVDKVCGRISAIIKGDIEQFLMPKIIADAEKYLARKKAEGKIGPKVFLKVAMRPEIFLSDPDIPGVAGVEERSGQPIIFPVIH